MRPTRRAALPRATVLLLSAALLVAGCDSPEQRLAAHYERAVELVAAKDDQKAALEFRNALKIDGRHAPSRIGLAAILEQTGDIAGALGHYLAAIEIDGADPASRSKAAQLLLVRGDAKTALVHAAEAVRLAPARPDAQATLAAALLRTGDAPAAIAAAKAALAIDPDNVAATLALAAEQLESQGPAAALATIEALLARKPDDSALNLMKLRLLEAAGDPAALRVHLEHLIALYPNETGFRRALARFHVQRGDVAAAEVQIRALADAAPQDVEATLSLVAFLRSTSGWDAARTELAARVAASEGDAARSTALRLALAQIEIDSGRRDEGVTLLRAMIAEAADAQTTAQARVLLGRTLLRNGDQAGALAEAAAVLDADGENGDALALRASVAIEQYRPQDAIADLRIALGLDPKNARLLLLEATAHERAGNLTVAGERLAAAARASDFDPELSQPYVAFLRSRQELKDAESVLTEIARRNPSHRATLLALAETRLRLEDWTGADQAAADLRKLDSGMGVADQITAASLGAQGKQAESLALLERMNQAPGRSSTALAALVAGYVRTGEIDQARALLDETLAKTPDDLRTQLMRAELDAVSNDFASAETRLLGIVATHPTASAGYIALSRLKHGLGELAVAEQIVRDGVAAAADTETLRFMLAQYVEARGAYDEAIDLYGALHDGNAGVVVYANNYASLLAEHRAQDPESIAKAARVAQRLRGYDVPELQDTYGWIMYLTGDLQAAYDTVLPAADALPSNAVVQYHAGRVLAARGEVELARGRFETARTLGGNSKIAAQAEAAISKLPPPAAQGQ